MRLFLLTFFLLYGTFHLYVFLKIRAAFDLRVITSIPLAVFMLVMIVAPVVVRVSEKAGYEYFARLMSYVGYMWLGLIFLLVSISILVDFYRILLYLATSILKKDFSSLYVSSRSAFAIPLLLSLAITAYGFFEAKHIRTEFVTIMTSKIPRKVQRLRIVQISDVHLGLIVREKRLKRILREVKRAEPDILVSTGDLVDGQIDNLEGLAELLREVKPRYGKFAITGNHEFYAGLDQSLNFTQKAGFTILRGETYGVEGLITIAGVDDTTGKYSNQYESISERDLLSDHSRERFTLLLKHRPLIDKDAVGLYDLQLSGHTHKGQIFPFGLITWLYYPVHAGCLKPVDGCYLYVSRGSGTWGPPIRFLAPPEVTVIDVVYGEKQEKPSKKKEDS